MTPDSTRPSAGSPPYAGPVSGRPQAASGPSDQPNRDDSTGSHAGPRHEPDVRFEVTVVDGEAGRRLAALQAEAILDVLTWLHEHRPDASR